MEDSSKSSTFIAFTVCQKSHFNPLNNPEITIIIFIFQMRKLKEREVK